jgi:hypothetical protein
MAARESQPYLLPCWQRRGHSIQIARFSIIIYRDVFSNDKRGCSWILSIFISPFCAEFLQLAAGGEVMLAEWRIQIARFSVIIYVSSRTMNAWALLDIRNVSNGQFSFHRSVQKFYNWRRGEVVLGVWRIYLKLSQEGEQYFVVTVTRDSSFVSSLKVTSPQLLSANY